mmetsp:Transcript_9461/g.24810  ORF Transcript_9461/g.24810 Transcript_9461/m.24810 type:complete len:246 (+) Transcript_9461:120-857(+)
MPPFDDSPVLTADSMTGPLDAMLNHFDTSPSDTDLLSAFSTILPTPRLPKFTHNTVSIFDWDDTLLVSTHVAILGLSVTDTAPLEAEMARAMAELEEEVMRTLDVALAHGETIIVTNAEAGWVELSAARFLPRVLDFIARRNIRVVSARTNYEEAFPNSPADWKVQAFVHEVRAGEGNVLVFGDSLSERIAGHALGMRCREARVKSVKFVERPDVEQLKRQLVLIQGSFGELYEHDASFDVNLVC